MYDDLVHEAKVTYQKKMWRSVQGIKDTLLMQQLFRGDASAEELLSPECHVLCDRLEALRVEFADVLK